MSQCEKLFQRLHNNPYPVILYPSPECGYVAEIPSLPGCLAQGETVADCMVELELVARQWIEVVPAPLRGA